MPDSSLIVVILSQRPLVRELLGELLRIRCGARILVKLGSLEPPPVSVTTAGVLVCDLHGLQPDALARFRERMLAANPRLRTVEVDDSLPGFSVEDVITAVRGVFAPAAVAHELLTPLELDVMLAVASGQRNADIARRMRRSSKTIEKHRANLQRKLGLRTVAHLTAYAIHHGLLRANAVFAPPHREGDFPSSAGRPQTGRKPLIRRR